MSIKKNITYVFLFLLLLTSIGCPSNKGSSGDDNVKVQNAVFATQPRNYAVVGVNYVYLPTLSKEDDNKDYSITEFTGVKGGSIDGKMINWTPELADIGSQELSIQVVSGNKTLHFSWTVEVAQPMKLPLGNLDSVENGISFTDNSFVEGYSLTIPPTAEMSGVKLSMGMADVDLTKGAFSHGLESQALILEFKEGYNSIGEYNDITGKSIDIEVEIKTKTLANPFMPPAPKENEQYFLVVMGMSTLDAHSAPGTDEIEMIPLNFMNDTLLTFFTHTFSQKHKSFNKQNLFMAQLVRTSSLKLVSDDLDIEVFWLFQDEEAKVTKVKKSYAELFIKNTLSYLQQSKQHFVDKGCAQPFVTKVFISPNLGAFSHKYKNIDRFTVPYISLSDCRNWGPSRSSCDYPMAKNLDASNEVFDDTYEGVSVWKQTVAHEFFHIQQQANSRLAHLFAKDPREWLVESTADFAAEEVFPDQAYFGINYGFNLYWGDELVRTGLTTMVDDGLASSFPGASHSKYQMNLFLQYIKKQRGGDLNICAFIKSPEYQNPAEPHYLFLSTFDEKVSYFKPIERLLDESVHDGLQAIKEAFAHFVFMYNYQVEDILPEMGALPIFDFAFLLETPLITSGSLPYTGIVSEDVIGGHSATLRSDADRTVQIEVRAELLEFGTPSTTFYAELYPMNVDLVTVVKDIEPIAIFTADSAKQVVNLDANREYALILTQGDMSGHLDNLLLGFNYVITEYDVGKPYLYFDSKYEYDHVSANNFQGHTRKTIAYVINGMNVSLTTMNFSRTIDFDNTVTHAADYIWDHQFSTEFKVLRADAIGGTHIPPRVFNPVTTGINVHELYNAVTFNDAAPLPAESLFNLDMDKIQIDSVSVNTSSVTINDLSNFISRGEVLLPSDDGFSESRQQVLLFPQVVGRYSCRGKGVEGMDMCRSAWSPYYLSLSDFAVEIAAAMSEAKLEADVTRWEIYSSGDFRSYSLRTSVLSGVDGSGEFPLHAYGEIVINAVVLP
ncbi:MAG: hypothetical protein HOO06_06685 [Bdellovibrionaceae bacterium]|nr:hypothetical protein [Pseudobdellovibrionaceae bacterium]